MQGLSTLNILIVPGGGILLCGVSIHGLSWENPKKKSGHKSQGKNFPGGFVDIQLEGGGILQVSVCVTGDP